MANADDKVSLPICGSKVIRPSRTHNSMFSARMWYAPMWGSILCRNHARTLATHPTLFNDLWTCQGIRPSRWLQASAFTLGRRRRASRYSTRNLSSICWIGPPTRWPQSSHLQRGRRSDGNRIRVDSRFGTVSKLSGSRRLPPHASQTISDSPATLSGKGVT